LFDCLGVAQAWGHLHDPNVAGGMDAEGIYNLALAAGYSKVAAQKAASLRALERMRRDLPP
jgi:hypothetical protein